MTFSLPLLVGGCVLALGPIVIHILFRRRYRTAEFAAMRFLLESLRRNKQRLRTEELILIALRVLACILIGLALANFRPSAGAGGSSAPSAHVFILDDSLSMGQQIATATLFQKALTEVARRLDSLSDADLVAVISASRPRSGEPLGKLVPAIDVKRDRFTSRLMAVRPSDLSADLPGALGEALKLVSLQQNMPARIPARVSTASISFPSKLWTLGATRKVSGSSPNFSMSGSRKSFSTRISLFRKTATGSVMTFR